MVYPERAEVHILADEQASREYINQMWAEAMEIYRKMCIRDSSKGEDTISPNGLRIVTILLHFETSIPTAFINLSLLKKYYNG